MSAQVKQYIQQAIQQFNRRSLRENSLHLLATLGYESDRQIQLPNTPAAFLEYSDREGKFRREKALFDEWQSVEVLCQITDDEIRQSNQMILMDSAGKVIDDTIIESYLFMAIGLRGEQYPRTALAHITREVNRLFSMPVMVIFQHGPTLTLSIINRRLHKRDRSKDVLEKVTLIKDVRIADPHRAHLEILFDLSLNELHRVHDFSNFVGLHRAWQKTLDSSELNKKFFKEIADWYFWAVNEVTFPKEAGPDETRSATSVIRLITRLIFVWFLKEKGLVPDELFSKRKLDELLLWKDFNDSTYYKAILQNLFFATLNQEMNTKTKPDNRKFRGTSEKSRDQHHMIHNVYRYERYFKNSEAALAIFADIPFLNGGLFECLDRKVDGKQIRIDGFSDRTDNALRVPDELFFGGERQVDLNDIYGTSGKRYQVRGIIHILNKYKFTIAENTPIEEEIALDPELLGKVFENLLAAYNPETDTTARKQTGSFYTPREIVNYMVDESLLAYLETKLNQDQKPGFSEKPGFSDRLRHLFAYNEEPHQFDKTETAALIAAIDNINILDPACGSGAFPMGILHKLVFILGKLDPNNVQWKERQVEPLRRAIKDVMAISDSRIRSQAVQELEEQIAAIEEAFARNELDYGRKLYLIENCIYGVDIQPVAVQIAKLRFFISLVVDQRLEEGAENRGILPLPNLETKFVAANTLLGIEKPAQMALRNPEITAKEEELAEVRSKHFRARTPRTKEKYRAEDKRLRTEISKLLEKERNLRNEDVRRLAEWDPYNQNSSADFFDLEWMFGLEGGFDVVIGNPPYVRMELFKDLKPALSKLFPQVYTGRADLYVYFYARSLEILKKAGVLSFISSNKFMRSKYGEKLRKLLGNHTQINTVIDFGDASVFSAIAYPSIVILKKSPPDSNKFKALSWEPGLSVKDFEEVLGESQFHMPQLALTSEGWKLEQQGILNLVEKLYQAGRPLGEYIEGRLFRGIVSGLNEAFVIDNKTRQKLINEDPNSTEIIKQWLRGRDVDKWQVKRSKLYVIFMPRGIDISRYPAIENHLRIFKTRLENRATSHLHPWYEMQQPQMGCYIEYEEPKIIYPDIAKQPAFAYDESRSYITNTLYVIPTKDKYLLGILNSNVTNFFYNQISSQVRGDYLRFIAQYVSQIPIPKIPNPKPLERLVNEILETKQKDSMADVSALEREIDELVYDLYGLTSAEIALLEGRELTEAEEKQLASAEQAKKEGHSRDGSATPISAPPLLFTSQPPQGSFSEKRARLDTLTKQATPAAIQELTAALTDDNLTIRWQAAAALRAIGKQQAPQVTGILQSFLSQTDNPTAKEEATKLIKHLNASQDI